MAEKPIPGSNNTPKTAEQLEKELDYTTELLRIAYTEIQELRKKLAEYEQLPDGYNRKWTWITKIVFTITQADRPLRSAEMLDILSRVEPALNKMNNKEKFLSSVLNTAMKHGRIVTYKLKGVRGYFYCLPEWMDSNGILGQEYRKKVF